MAADVVLKELSAACASARSAGADDAVAGVAPRYAASPASVEEASALLRAAAAHDLAVVPKGSGSKLAWGAAPARCDLVVDTLGMTGVLEHAAGDLVARVQAGVPLTRLAEVLAAAGQQLAVDVPAGPGGAPAGTAGGLLATAVAGPRRLRYGTPRDLVIGITVVRADGTVARSGGKVVKNVAGYDLGKLFAGSYGTLGLIAEAVFRLHPLPAASAFVSASFGDAATARQAVATAAASDASPAAVEINRPGRGGPVEVAALFEGEPAALGQRCETVSRALGRGAVSEQPPGWWGQAAAVPAGPAGTGTLIRIGFWAAALPGVLAAVDRAGEDAGVDPAVGGSAAAGVLYVRLAADSEAGAVAAFVSALRAELGREGARSPAAAADITPPAVASAVVLHAPPGVRGQLDLWGPVPSLSLMRAVKDQFDPAHRMAPGRFAGGI